MLGLQTSVPEQPGHETALPQLLLTEPHLLPEHVVATASAVHEQAPCAEQVLSGATQDPQLTVAPQLFTLVPQTAAPHVVAIRSGTQAMHWPEPLQLAPVPLHVPQLTGVPQLLVTVPQTRAPHVTAVVSGVQTQVPDPLQVRFGAVPQVPQLTGVPQLLLTVPHVRLPHVMLVGCAVQTHVPVLGLHVRLGAVLHVEPQLTVWPQLSTTVPHVREPQAAATLWGTQQRCGAGPVVLQTLPASHLLLVLSQPTQPFEPTLQTMFCAAQSCTMVPHPLGAGAPCEQVGDTKLVPWQVTTPQSGTGPFLQTPPSQVSTPSHFWPFEQLTPVAAGLVVHLPLTQSRTKQTSEGTSHWAGDVHGLHAAVGSCFTPPGSTQLSIVQALPSSMSGGCPATHVPLPSHDSLPLQT